MVNYQIKIFIRIKKFYIDNFARNEFIAICEGKLRSIVGGEERCLGNYL